MDSKYKSAGVDIKAGSETVDKVKDIVKSTFNNNVLTGIGHFGAFYEIDTTKFKKPVLVSSVDGVGTKLKVAVAMDKHDTIGQDLVNHCVNDISVCGAVPQYFMDYLAFGKLNSEKASDIIKGFAKACSENNISLIGGETAEMPGVYQDEDYDISGTIVGIVEKDEIIDGSQAQRGDLIIGFRSNGLHTNGYSLARKVLFEKFKLESKPDLLDRTVGEELLRIHKSYLPIISELKKHEGLKAFSHITGGGIVDNTKRVISDDLKIKIDWNSFEVMPVFKLIQEIGGIDHKEMREVFNLGIGLAAVVSKDSADDFLKKAQSLDENACGIGEIK